MYKFIKRLIALICFVIPVIGAVIYYTSYASPQYTSTVKFAVQGAPQQQTGLAGLVGAIGGIAASNSDAWLIAEYIESGEFLFEDGKDGVRDHYSDSNIDYLSRLSSDAQAEEVLEYWQDMFDFEFDFTSGVTSLSVHGFDRQFPPKLLELILDKAAVLINDLSKPIYQDNYQIAQQEFEAAEKNLLALRDRVYALRESSQSVNPLQDSLEDAGSEIQLSLAAIGTLEQQLTELEAKEQAQQKMTPNGSLALTEVRQQVRFTRSEIGQKRAKLKRLRANRISEDDQSALDASSSFEELQAQLEIATEFYKAKLSTLESVKLKLAEKQKYLSIIVAPTTPEKSMRPDIPYSILTVTVIALITWFGVLLIVAAIRDHIGWS